MDGLSGSALRLRILRHSATLAGALALVLALSPSLLAQQSSARGNSSSGPNGPNGPSVIVNDSVLDSLGPPMTLPGLLLRSETEGEALAPGQTPVKLRRPGTARVAAGTSTHEPRTTKRQSTAVKKASTGGTASVAPTLTPPKAPPQVATAAPPTAQPAPSAPPAPAPAPAAAPPPAAAAAPAPTPALAVAPAPTTPTAPVQSVVRRPRPGSPQVTMNEPVAPPRGPAAPSAPNSAAPTGPAPAAAAAPQPSPPTPAAAPTAPPPSAPATAPAAAVPAPPAAAAPATPPQVASLPRRGGLPAQILFAPNVTDLPDQVKPALDAVVVAMKADEQIRIQIVGYASGLPDDASRARRISLQRAVSVRAYLMEQGMRNTQRMDVRALGNKTDAGGPADRVDVMALER
jgi:outer membrane protein OmpA-like peptidoglycan-associated protein